MGQEHMTDRNANDAGARSEHTGAGIDAGLGWELRSALAVVLRIVPFAASMVLMVVL
jgi:hypothetical protein